MVVHLPVTALTCAWYYNELQTEREEKQFTKENISSHDNPDTIRSIASSGLFTNDMDA